MQHISYNTGIAAFSGIHTIPKGHTLLKLTEICCISNDMELSFNQRQTLIVTHCNCGAPFLCYHDVIAHEVMGLKSIICIYTPNSNFKKLKGSRNHNKK